MQGVRKKERVPDKPHTFRTKRKIVVLQNIVFAALLPSCKPLLATWRNNSIICVITKICTLFVTTGLTL